MSRSSSPFGLGALALLLSSGSLVQAVIPTGIKVFETSMTIPAVAKPTPILNGAVDYYEIPIKEFKKKIAENLETTMIGYNGTYPGPTIRVEKGKETVIRFVNKEGKNPSAIHLHGSPSRAPWDGWADDKILNGQYKDYYYPNYQSARMLWYHDHVIGKTSENVNQGQAGAYIITDKAEEERLKLPTGDFDVPLLISAKQYDPKTGDIVGNNEVIDVNGIAWPYFDVQPRKYRLRFLDASVQRPFNLSFQPDEVNSPVKKLKFSMISSDAGLLTERVVTEDFHIAPAERYEIVIDFKDFKGKNITLRNSLPGNLKDVDKVMRFVVSNTDATGDTPEVPQKLRLTDLPNVTPGAKTQLPFILANIGGTWSINEKTWDKGEEGRIMANVSRGTVEQWTFVNTGTGGHPIHTHLIDFRVIKRVQNGANGRSYVEAYEESGLKDVIWVNGQETVTVEAHYAPWDGLYMMHCHNLGHEDNKMIGAFRVEKLADLGYTETSFFDPMEKRWAAKPWTESESTLAKIEAAVQLMVNETPYKNVETVYSTLSAYWASHPKPTAAPARMARSWEA